MKAENPDLEVILVPGDIVTHGLAQNLGTFSQDIYEQLLETLKSVSELFETYFSDILVLPIIGNGDTKYNYQPPVDEDKDEYLSDLTKLWFERHNRNKNLPNLNQDQMINRDCLSFSA